jgi:hypothetical protein
MALRDYTNDINDRNSLVWQTSSRLDMWLKLLDRLRENDPYFSSFLARFDGQNDVILRRREIRTLYRENPEYGMVAAIIWAHARGIRVNALSLLVRDLPALVRLFARDNFDDHAMHHLLGQPGISVPTASKLLSACGKKFEGLPAAVLDDAICQAIESPEFSKDFRETNLLRGKVRSRAMHYYRAYLNDISRLTQQYDLDPDDLDRFLAEYASGDRPEGLNACA